jgi:hypothetical protein
LIQVFQSNPPDGRRIGLGCCRQVIYFSFLVNYNSLDGKAMNKSTKQVLLALAALALVVLVYLLASGKLKLEGADGLVSEFNNPDAGKPRSQQRFPKRIDDPTGLGVGRYVDQPAVIIAGTGNNEENFLNRTHFTRARRADQVTELNYRGLRSRLYPMGVPGIST